MDYINSILKYFSIKGMAVDYINSILKYFSIKGMARLKSYCAKQSCAITLELLIKMSSVLNLIDHSDRVQWCLFLFAFFPICKEIQFSTQ